MYTTEYGGACVHPRTAGVRRGHLDGRVTFKKFTRVTLSDTFAHLGRLDDVH